MCVDNVSLFTLMNEYCEGKQCPGFIIVEKDKIHKYYNGECPYLQSLEEKLELKLAQHELPLMALFCPHRKHELNKIELQAEQYSESEACSDLFLNAEGDAWGRDTERLVQQISLRYAHEVLNALTPVYGILQMLKQELDDKLSEKELHLLEIAQEELIKGKNYVNDFMTINFHATPNPDWYTLKELKEYIEKKLLNQAPEFLPHITFNLINNDEKMVFIDKNQLRLVVQLAVTKWLDYAKSPSVISVDFHLNNTGEFIIEMQMQNEGVSLHQLDDEFTFYLHLIKQNVKRNGGKLELDNGILLTYQMDPVLLMESQ